MGLREAQRILFDLLALTVNMATGFELSIVFDIHTCCVGVRTDFFTPATRKNDMFLGCVSR